MVGHAATRIEVTPALGPSLSDPICSTGWPGRLRPSGACRAASTRRWRGFCRACWT